MTADLVTMPHPSVPTVRAEDFMPILDLTLAVQRHDVMVQIAQQLMVKDVDYGQVPGTEKPCLFKPGAEKLCSMFGLSPEFILEVGIEDWAGQQFGRPLFYYRYKCRLTRNGIVMGEGIGSCNSWETKYGYRWVTEEQLPPGTDLNKLTKKDGRKTHFEFDFAIQKAETNGQYGKPAEYWEMFRAAIENGTAKSVNRKTKAGKEFPGHELEIGTIYYRVPNPEIFDQVNTVQKMAEKRALIAGVLIATNASEFYTQDVEDMEVVYDVPYTVVSSTPVPTAPAPETKPETPKQEAPAPEPPKQQTAPPANVTVIGEHKIPRKEPAAPPPAQAEPEEQQSPAMTKEQYQQAMSGLAKTFNSAVPAFRTQVFTPLCRGYFGEPLPKEYDAYAPIFAAIEQATGDAAILAELCKNPHDYGQKLAANPPDLDAYIEALIAARPELKDVNGVIEHLKKVGIDPANEADCIAYLRLACITRSAQVIVGAVRVRKSSVADTVAAFEQYLGAKFSDVPQSDLETKLVNFITGN